MSNDYDNGAHRRFLPPDNASSGKKPSSRNGLTYFALLAALVGWILAVVFICLWCTDHNGRTDDLPPSYISPSWLPHYWHGAVASDDGQCSEVGRDVMMKGGNAVDAAIAALLCNGVKNYHSMGLGGGFFLIYYQKKTDECFYVDAREAAPLKYALLNDEDRRFGWKSVGVPGELAGYMQTWNKFKSGHLNVSELFTPAITAARDGSYINHALGRSLALIETYFNASQQETLAPVIDPETGEFLSEGDFVKLPVLAKTLTQLSESEDPEKLFYKGEIADKLIKDIQDNGGILSHADLEEYNVRIGPALTTTLRDGSRVCTIPAPGGGPVHAMFLRLVEELNLSSYDASTASGSALIYHYLIEALKVALAEHQTIEDPIGSSDQSLADHLMEMLSDEYIQNIAQNIITAESHDAEYYLQKLNDVQPHEEGGTAHLSLVDKDGNAVSVTSSINYYLGSQRRSVSTGIVLNNHLMDFREGAVVNGEVRNKIGPLKRPRSAMTPSIIVNPEGNVNLILGASGGGHIIAAASFVAARVLFLNETIKEATDAARVHIKLKPFKTLYEEHMPESVLADLKQRGHNMTLDTKRKSIVQSAQKKGRFLYAHADHRKGGYPAGY